MNQLKNKILIIITVSICIILLTASGGVFLWYKNSKKMDSQSSSRNSEGSASNLQIKTNEAIINKKEDNTTSAKDAPIPKQPTLTKSSGNNGPVPVGVNINFVCTAEPGLDCSIVLDSDSKNAVVGPAKVTDNGRGQYFASLYWTSVKGSYKVTAQAKNIQGGISSSIVQTLEVQ
jgi:hypothetical protein